ncbi:15-hydroxyprostaglandin dehydrogenase [NAD(+)]-like isoform X2 [Babylonia areolata]
MSMTSATAPAPATYDVKGKHVFLTGGGRGFGRSVVDALLAKGSKVVFCDIIEENGRAAESDFQKTYGKDVVTFLPCDVKNDQQFKEVWKKAVEILGNIDVCINNAAIVNETHYETSILVNLGGTIRGSVLAYEHMRTDRGGRGGVILNVASNGGIRHNCAGIPAYASTKHGIVGYTLSWASDPHTPERGVRWCTFCPESIETPIIRMVPEQVTLPFDEWQGYVNALARQPADQVAQGLMALLEDGNSNGHALRVYKDKGEIIYHTMANNSPDNFALCALVDVSRRVVPPYVPKSQH